LPARFSDDVAADLRHQPSRRESLEKLRWRQAAAHGMLPTNQRLQRYETPRRGRHDRLVVQPELSTLDGVMQLRLELQSRPCLLVHAVVEQSALVATQ